MRDIDVRDHERFTRERPVRRLPAYLMGAVGGSVALTFAMALFVVWTALSPASAEEARVVRGPGKGFYDAASLSGPAARDVRSYMDRTWVECDDPKGHGRCNLNASVDSLDVHYMGDFDHEDAYAVAYIVYENDTGNRPATRLGLWRRESEGRFDLLATTDEVRLVVDRSVSREGGANFLLSGLVQGPNDGFCCPSTKAAFDVAYADGKLTVTEVPSAPTPTRIPSATRRKPISNALAALAGAPTPEATMLFAKPAKKTWITGFDFTYMNYAGEEQTPFVHNGSYVSVFPEHGLVSYMEPKPSMRGVVKQGDLILKAAFGKTEIVGTAYLYRPGCAPLPYRVSGPAYRSEGVPFVLRGVAPVRARDSCEVVGTTSKGPNAVLRFEPAGGYNEPPSPE